MLILGSFTQWSILLAELICLDLPVSANYNQNPAPAHTANRSILAPGKASSPDQGGLRHDHNQGFKSGIWAGISSPNPHPSPL